MPTLVGDVLWVGEETVGDAKGAAAAVGTRTSNACTSSGVRIRTPRTRLRCGVWSGGLRPVWVVLDTWSHYLQLHRVKDTAGPGEQGLLIGDIVNLAREFGSAFAISHHNRKNPSPTAESGDTEGEYRDSTATGAAVDMIVSVSRGRALRSRRLTPPDAGARIR